MYSTPICKFFVLLYCKLMQYCVIMNCCVCHNGKRFFVITLLCFVKFGKYLLIDDLVFFQLHTYMIALTM